MREYVSGDSFNELFRTFSRSAVRLETRPAYVTDDERLPLERFLERRPVPLAWFKPWLHDVLLATSSGRQYRRVRIYDEPLTEYLRFELWTCQYNVEAGEDIRYLPTETATSLHLPGYDYWLFDDELLALMYFTEAGEPLGAQLVDDAAVVATHRRWFEVAAGNSTPYEKFAAAHPVEATAE